MVVQALRHVVILWGAALLKGRAKKVPEGKKKGLIDKLQSAPCKLTYDVVVKPSYSFFGNNDIRSRDEIIMNAKGISKQLLQPKVCQLATFDGLFLASGDFTILNGYFVANFGSALGGNLGAVIAGYGYFGAVNGFNFP